VARAGDRNGVYIIWVWVKLKERDYLENPDVDERIILKWIFKK